MKRYWTSQYEKEAMADLHERKLELSKQLRTALKAWRKDQDKKDLKEVKKMLTAAKSNPSIFSKAMRAMGDAGQSVMDVYLNSWMVFGTKPKKAKVAVISLTRNAL